MMRKTPKIALRKETIRTLSGIVLGRVGGGQQDTNLVGDDTGAKNCPGFFLADTSMAKVGAG